MSPKPKKKARQSKRAAQGLQRQGQQRPAPVPQAVIETLQQFSGPIPPPHLLREYDELIPNGAERIFAQFERQTLHRQGIEKDVITNGIRQQRLGQWMAFILAVLGLTLAVVMVLRGDSGQAVGVFIFELVGLCGLFVHGRRVQERERIAKFAAGVD